MGSAEWHCICRFSAKCNLVLQKEIPLKMNQRNPIKVRVCFASQYYGRTDERTDKKGAVDFFFPYENKVTRAEWQLEHSTLFGFSYL